MDPFAVLSAAIVFILALAATRTMSVASLAGSMGLTLAFIVLASAGFTPAAYVVYGVVATALIWWRHRSNIQRLLAGTEPKLGQRATPPVVGESPPA
jgi:glycerol-3-phosphate acyltransferase PlsY